jgi:5-oxoprolinase (ATP-hydrolysing)
MSDWEFWIDVGGTFTDCLARAPDGRVLTRKVLSSGVTKGTVAASPTPSTFIDELRRGDPKQFWQGYEATFSDASGAVLHRDRIAAFDSRSGRFTLAHPLPNPLEAGARCELSSGEDAPLLAIRLMLELGLDEPLPPMLVKLGTTRGTNALLTRGGARTAFVTTRGFADVLRIANQDRPRLFDLDIKKPDPLFSSVVEIDERLDAFGAVLRSPNPAQVRKDLARLREEGLESLAICLLHAFANPAHEELVERIARDVGFVEVSTSSKLSPLIKIVSRGDTTVVDAYLNPVLRAYVDRLSRGLGTGRLKLMTSAGGLVDAARFVGKDSILSGPLSGPGLSGRSALTWGAPAPTSPGSPASTNANSKSKRRASALWHRCSPSKRSRPAAAASVTSTGSNSSSARRVPAPFRGPPVTVAAGHSR